MAKPEAQPEDSAIPFEEAIEELETIVKEMESARLPLDVLLEKYEKGNRLLKICQHRIEQAELRIERIASGKDGIQLDPFQPQAGDPSPSSKDTSPAAEEACNPTTESDASADEIKLF